MVQFPTGIKGVDVYHGDNVVSFYQLLADGIKFAFLKATQGVSDIDPMYANYKSRCIATGILPGAYHFFTADDPAQQAKHFVNNVGGLPGMIGLVVDVETYFEGVGAAVKVFLAEVKALTGHTPDVYVSPSFKDSYLSDLSADDTVWLAEYGVSSPRAACSFWQWSDTAMVEGIEGPCDADVYNGTIDQLKAMVFTAAA